MLAICEECSKKYNIDASKMKSPRAKFTRRECGHIIVVVKGQGSGEPAPADAAVTPESIGSSPST